MVFGKALVKDTSEAIRQIRKMNPEIPVYAITACFSGVQKAEAEDAGCNEFLSKPVRKELLFEKLNQYNVYCT
jgi:two-component system, cell cycle response regulator DivK